MAATAAPCLAARAIVISTSGNDGAAGSAAAPYLTLQKAMSAAQAGDTVYIAKGEYDCAEFSAEVNHPLTIVGESKDATILKNFGGLKFTSGLGVKKLTFADSRGTIFKPSAAEGQKLDGVLIEDCAFTNIRNGVVSDEASLGAITNFTVRNCHFKDMAGDKVYGIAITTGTISRVIIADNTFQNLATTRKACVAIAIGGNQTRDTAADIIISGNRIENVSGPSDVETHGILGYGKKLQIIKNTVKGLNKGGNHEAIYLKASHSLVAENVLEDCSSDQGDIGIKGGELSGDNIIRDNRILGQGTGLGIYAHGSVVVKGNRIQKPNGDMGIRLIAYNKPVVVQDNYVEVTRASVRINDCPDTTITGNTFVSNLDNPIDLTGSCKVNKIDGNKTQKNSKPSSAAKK